MDTRYENKHHEAQCQQEWLEHNTYATENNPGTLYTIDTPPPTVSGSLHIGHIFSYTQTDIIARYKRMHKFSVFYPFGFDDNGLPTEKYVEKKCKVRPHEMGRSAFIQLCLAESKKAAQEFIALWQQLGLSVDWTKTYSTISDASRKLSQASFIELYKKDFIYRLYEPALYCINCQTSVAQAELDNVTLPSLFNNIIFKDHHGNDLIIATTRPELLPACVAIFYHPDDIRYQSLKNTKATVPLFGYEVPIIADEMVDMDKGTGLVMCCTFGDKTDILWFKKHNLPFKELINTYGKLNDIAGEFAQLSIKDARNKIIDKLQEQELIITQKPIEHAVNVHERCKKEIEYRMLSQWFVKILPYKETFIQQAEHINWYPSFMKSRYIDWVKNLNWDWCISRQRFYGIPFPAWHCTNCNHIVLADPDQLPIDPQEVDVSDQACPSCHEKKLVPDNDVMDTWNTSSLSPYLCAEQYKTTGETFTEKIHPFLPMSMRPQAHDIIRTWAFTTIVKTWMHHNTIPWESIVISGHVLSDGKEKLSKSKNNSLMAPDNLLQRYPADAIRYWTATGGLGHDMAFSENQLKIGTKLLNKLWNAFRFAKDHIENVTDMHTPPTTFGLVNEWILDRISRTDETYTHYLEKNEFGLALQQVEQFFWQDFCDNYIELIKHQLFNPDQYDALHVQATQWTLHHVGFRILQLFAPYIPFVTETIYKTVYHHNVPVPSIHQTKFADYQTNYVFTQAVTTTEHIIHIISGVRKLKSEAQISLKTVMPTLTIYCTDDTIRKNLLPHLSVIKGITQAEDIIVKEHNGKTSLKDIDGFWHGHINIEQ